MNSPAGLSEEEIARFRRDGFLGPYRAMSEHDAAAARDAIVRGVIGENADQIGPVVQCRHLDRREVYELCVQAAIVDRVAGLLGNDLVLWRSNLWCKQPGADGVAWHQDLTNWPIAPVINVSAWLALDRADLENGCLEIIPGSHHEVHPTVRYDGDPLTDSVDPKAIDPTLVRAITLEPGEFFLFSEKLLHHSGRNESPRRRLGLAIRITVPRVRVDHSRLCDGEHRNIVIRGADRVGLNMNQAPPDA